MNFKGQNNIFEESMNNPYIDDLSNNIIINQQILFKKLNNIENEIKNIKFLISNLVSIQQPSYYQQNLSKSQTQNAAVGTKPIISNYWTTPTNASWRDKHSI